MSLRGDCHSHIYDQLITRWIKGRIWLFLHRWPGFWLELINVLWVLASALEWRKTYLAFLAAPDWGKVPTWFHREVVTTAENSQCLWDGQPLSHIWGQVIYVTPVVDIGIWVMTSRRFSSPASLCIVKHESSRALWDQAEYHSKLCQLCPYMLTFTWVETKLDPRSIMQVFHGKWQVVEPTKECPWSGKSQIWGALLGGAEPSGSVYRGT